MEKTTFSSNKRFTASYTDQVFFSQRAVTCLECIQVVECLQLEFVVESGHHVVPALLAPNHRGSEDPGVSLLPNEMQNGFSQV